jgi:hypothetical protein
MSQFKNGKLIGDWRRPVQGTWANAAREWGSWFDLLASVDPGQVSHATAIVQAVEPNSGFFDNEPPWAQLQEMAEWLAGVSRLNGIQKYVVPVVDDVTAAAVEPRFDDVEALRFARTMMPVGGSATAGMMLADCLLHAPNRLPELLFDPDAFGWTSHDLLHSVVRRLPFSRDGVRHDQIPRQLGALAAYTVKSTGATYDEIDRLTRHMMEGKDLPVEQTQAEGDALCGLLEIEDRRPGRVKRLLSRFALSGMLQFDEVALRRMDGATLRPLRAFTQLARVGGSRERPPEQPAGARLVLLPGAWDKKGVFTTPMRADGPATVYAYIHDFTESEAIVRRAASAADTAFGLPVAEVLLSMHGSSESIAASKESQITTTPLRRSDVTPDAFANAVCRGIEDYAADEVRLFVDVCRQRVEMLQAFARASLRVFGKVGRLVYGSAPFSPEFVDFNDKIDDPVERGPWDEVNEFGLVLPSPGVSVA